MRKATYSCLFLVALGVAGWLLWTQWKQGEPRRTAVASLTNFQRSLDAAEAAAVLDSLVIPPSLAARTTAEQAEFVKKALHDEVSEAGIAALRKHASFGPLGEIFPEEAKQWASLAGAAPDQCVAFRMERSGVRAEVVLVRFEDTYKIIRCNNVKQMASE